MDINTIIKAARRWWWIGLLPVVVVILYLTVTYQKPPTTYAVPLRIATGGMPTSALSDDYDRYYAWLASEYIANGLADIATSDAFAALVSEALKTRQLEIQPAAVRSAITSDNTQSTTFLTITWHDPTEAVQIAEVVSEVLINTAPNFYPQMSQLGAVGRLVDNPVAHPLPPSLRAQLTGPLLRLALAVVAGCGFILLAYFLDPAVRDRTDLENKNLAFLGAIPKY